MFELWHGGDIVTITNGYLLSEEAVAYVGQSISASTDFIDDCVTAASRLIENYTGRRFYLDASPSARTYDAVGGTDLDIDDVASVTTVKTDDGSGAWATTIASTDYQLSSPVRGWPRTHIRLLAGTFPTPSATTRTDLIEVTGIWGWATVPAEVTAACRLVVAELVKLRDAPLGVAGGADFGVAYTRNDMPSRARQLLDPYRHVSTFGIA